MLVDDNGVSCFTDDLGITSWTDDNGLLLTCGAAPATTSTGSNIKTFSSHSNMVIRKGRR